MTKSLAIALCLALLSLTNCAGLSDKQFVWQDQDISLFWPAPPDQPRIRYLRSLSGPEDFKGSDKESAVLNWLFGQQQKEFPFVTPFSVAVSNAGVVWIVDSSTAMLYRYDSVRHRVDYYESFSAENLSTPSGVVVDDQRQRVFVADAEKRQVFVIDFEGEYLGSRVPEEGFGRPSGMTIDPAGRLLVTDAEKGKVYIFNPDGSLATTLQSRLSENGRFNRPISVAVGPGGEFLILDAFAFQVEVQDAQGRLLRTIGGLGDAAGYFARPKGLAVDGEGHVFVSDAAFDNIQVFDLDGNLLMHWGGPGNGAGQFNLPAGLFVDSGGRLFVADSYNHRIQVFQLLH